MPAGAVPNYADTIPNHLHKFDQLKWKNILIVHKIKEDEDADKFTFNKWLNDVDQ